MAGHLETYRRSRQQQVLSAKRLPKIYELRLDDSAKLKSWSAESSPGGVPNLRFIYLGPGWYLA